MIWDGRGACAAVGAEAADLAQSVIVNAIYRGLDLIFASAETLTPPPPINYDYFKNVT